MSSRALKELIEADVEQVFSLVDMAEEQATLGNPETGTQMLRAAEGVFDDIQQRLIPLGAADASPFSPLVEELRRAIENARSRFR